MMAGLIEPGSTVLFQGDSITDGDRYRQDPASLGRGYAMIAAGWYSAVHPGDNVTFLNRGISGNRTVDLEARWDEDCLALQPDWISIMIGINDTWRRYDRNDPTSTEAYETSYRNLLTRAGESTGARFVLIEPFVLPHPADRKQWREDLDPRIAVVHRLANEFDAVLIKMDHLLNATAPKVAPAFWAGDGVHPSPAGHAFMAQAWLRAMGAMA